MSEERTIGVETYLYDFTEEIYGKEIVVELLEPAAFSLCTRYSRTKRTGSVDAVSLFSGNSIRMSIPIFSNADSFSSRLISPCISFPEKKARTTIVSI